jgi:centromere protein I
MKLIALIASKTPAKSRDQNISGIVNQICSYAFEHGLPNSQLQSIVNILVQKTTLDQSSITTIIKNLYPTDQISSDIVIQIVGSLGQGIRKPSAHVQNALLRWLCIVYSIVEDPRILSKLYGTLFNMLDMVSLR